MYNSVLYATASFPAFRLSKAHRTHHIDVRANSSQTEPSAVFVGRTTQSVMPYPRQRADRPIISNPSSGARVSTRQFHRDANTSSMSDCISPVSGVTIIFASRPRKTFATGRSPPFEPLMPVQIDSRLHCKTCQCTVYAILTARLLHYHHIGTCTYFICQQTRNPVSTHNSGHFGPPLPFWTLALPGLPMATPLSPALIREYHVCVEPPPPSDLTMTLPAFAAERRRACSTPHRSST